MSNTSSTAQTSHAQGIPIRRVVLNDATQLPSDYCTTPGGTLFSTTPGGTRIIYDRRFLMQCRNSPLTKSPPPNLPKIPGVTTPGTDKSEAKENESGQQPKPTVPKTKDHAAGDEPQFAMDI